MNGDSLILLLSPQDALALWRTSWLKPTPSCPSQCSTCRLSWSWVNIFILSTRTTGSPLWQASPCTCFSKRPWVLIFFFFLMMKIHSTYPVVLKNIFTFFPPLCLWTGDFFKDELPKADLYILARVLHDWSDEKVHILLSKIADACSPGTVLQMNFNPSVCVCAFFFFYVENWMPAKSIFIAYTCLMKWFQSAASACS